MLLPVALLANPSAWFADATVLGGSSGFVPARFSALVDALKPILGVDGDPGEWRFTKGVRVKADADASGAARFALSINSGEFAPIPGATGRLWIGGSFGLSFPVSGPPRPAVDLHAGTGDGSSDRPAVHVVFADGLRVFFRPGTGADLPLYPSSAGLGGLAQAAGQVITQALPFVLDKVAALGGQAGIKGRVGELVAAAGDALALRSSGQFSGAALQAWAADPPAAFAARLPSATLLGQLAGAIRPLLPAGGVADVVGADLRVQVGPMTVRVTPSPFAIAVSGDVTGVPAVDRVVFGIAVNASGLRALDIEVGPASIDAGGVDLHPFGVHAGAAPAGGRRSRSLLVSAAIAGSAPDGCSAIVSMSSSSTPASKMSTRDASRSHSSTVLGVVASFVMNRARISREAVGSSTVRDACRALDGAVPSNWMRVCSTRRSS